MLGKRRLHPSHTTESSIVDTSIGKHITDTVPSTSTDHSVTRIKKAARKMSTQRASYSTAEVVDQDIVMITEDQVATGSDQLPLDK